MKMRLGLTLLLSLFTIAGFGKPQVYFKYNIFHTPESEAYITTTLQFLSHTFKFIGNEEGALSAKVEITQIFSQNGEVVLADKYELNSPMMKDSTVEDFYDIQRYSLKEGVYDYELIIEDQHSGESVSGKQSITVNPLPSDKIVISDIEFIEDAYRTDENSNFSKSGYFMLPYLTNYFPPDMNKIAFYYELYNTEQIIGENEDFLMTCNVEDYLSGELMNDIFKFNKLRSGPVCPGISVVPIDQLPSGDYNLLINILNKNYDTLATKEVFFQRRNDLLNLSATSVEDVEIDPTFKNSINRDSIPYFLGSIMPISERYEYETIRKLLKSRDTVMMEKYFFSFWKETSPNNTYVDWLEYKDQVRYAEKLFGTQIKYGWETDRGRIHLKYGSPNSIIDRPNEPSAYPYQIWHYYRIGKRSDVRFVFYNPDLVTNDYPLLHSDMQGELQNYRWEIDLHKRDNPNTNLDDTNGSSHYGGNVRTLYR